MQLEKIFYGWGIIAFGLMAINNAYSGITHYNEMVIFAKATNFAMTGFYILLVAIFVKGYKTLSVPKTESLDAPTIENIIARAKGKKK
jgi:hypothetical protein